MLEDKRRRETPRGDAVDAAKWTRQIGSGDGLWAVMAGLAWARGGVEKMDSSDGGAALKRRGWAERHGQFLNGPRGLGWFWELSSDRRRT
ncbi:hypothetical protein M0R45_001820 [Rubus argutus]|uniref:Uncharacterized protein n=1 Tax=Rubus argutus TaxID=59490 RepID=A0AAW1VJZ9_RUBAR